MFTSLRFRLIASFAVIVFVTLAAAAMALFSRLGGYRDELAASTLQQVAAPIYYNLTLFTPQPGEATPAGRRLNAGLLEYLELQRQAGVTVTLVDSAGAVIPESAADPDLLDERFTIPPPPQRGPNFSELPQQQYTTSEGKDLLYVIIPTPRFVRARDAGIAGVVVSLPEASRRDVWSDLTPRLLFAGGIGILTAIIAVLVLWASMFRTLGKATGGIRAVAAGDFSQRVPETGPSEVRRLARDVNAMAESVQASQRTLREFLANVSHELKTPLTSIRGFSGALLDGTLESPEERARAARVIDAESRRVLHLVGELMDLSRIESGQQEMELSSVPIAELVGHVADVFAIRAADAGVRLEVNEPPATMTVRADFDRIEQVLGNLLDNAFRHTPRGGAIEVGARSAGGAMHEIYVADSGAGIAADDLPHVFDRFYRSTLGGPETPGSGLGLAISREIVRAHGGAIRAVPRNGGGVEFAFTLPRSPDAPAPGPSVSPRPEPPPAAERLRPDAAP